MKKLEIKSAEIGLDLLFQAATLGLVTIISATAAAPILPQELKQEVNKIGGHDLDKAHEYWKDKIIEGAENIEDAVKELSGFKHAPRIGRQSSEQAADKCKAIRLGNWIFTIRTPYCS